MMWVPQSFGSPNIAGNQPPDYWPGGRYVDWVGIDIYSKFAGAFDEGKAFFERYDKWPFVIGEYGPWDNDYGGAFVKSLFGWAAAHDRVKMLLYYRDFGAGNAYELSNYPSAAERAALDPQRRPLDRVRPRRASQIPDPPPSPAPPIAPAKLAPNPAANLP